MVVGSTTLQENGHMEKSTVKLKKTSPEILFLSFFNIGFLPLAPGTWGTIATMPFLWFFSSFNTPWFFLAPFVGITTIVSCFIAEYVQKKHHLHDPQWIVIDEVLGMALAWFFLLELNWLHALVLFSLFRLFDIIKVWPANFFDKLEHGAGTILDDIVSGLFAGLTYRLLFLIYAF